MCECYNRNSAVTRNVITRLQCTCYNTETFAKILSVIYKLRPNVGPESCRIDLICFLTGLRKRYLNEALVSLGVLFSVRV